MQQKDANAMHSRPQTSGGSRRPNICRTIAVSVCLVTLMAGCGGDSNTDTDADPNTIQITPEALMEEAERQEDAPDCEDFYEDGATTTDEMDGTMCKRADGELFVPGTARRTCTDGREVMWNDEGWGFLGEPWHRHADDTSRVPPANTMADCPAG